ncbi:MAG: nuclear transport factor 2 family protein [Alistipes sp.]|nr:nuclear transport factor 2 family protein [Alistipes sp.]
MRRFFALLSALVITLCAIEVCAVEKDSSAKEKEIIELSNAKWQWMADKDADKLADLFHENSVFVHMGGAWGKKQEVDIIRGGMIHYKQADVKNVSVRFAGETAVVLCDMNLLAVVGGNEVTNHFMVTEVYVKEKKSWKLASLSFTKLSR